VYAPHKSGGGEIVGAFNENTEPRDFFPPLGQGRFPLLTYLTGNGFGFFEHRSNELMFLTQRTAFLPAQAGSVAVL
jgi:hypothetical protein